MTTGRINQVAHLITHVRTTQTYVHTRAETDRSIRAQRKPTRKRCGDKRHTLPHRPRHTRLNPPTVCFSFRRSSRRVATSAAVSFRFRKCRAPQSVRRTLRLHARAATALHTETRDRTKAQASTRESPNAQCEAAHHTAYRHTLAPRRRASHRQRPHIEPSLRGDAPPTPTVQPREPTPASTTNVSSQLPDPRTASARTTTLPSG